MTECPTLQNARNNDFNENDPINFLFEESAVAINYLRDAGFSETTTCI